MSIYLPCYEGQLSLVKDAVVLRCNKHGKALGLALTTTIPFVEIVEVETNSPQGAGGGGQLAFSCHHKRFNLTVHFVEDKRSQAIAFVAELEQRTTHSAPSPLVRDFPSSAQPPTLSKMGPTIGYALVGLVLLLLFALGRSSSPTFSPSEVASPINTERPKLIAKAQTLKPVVKKRVVRAQPTPTQKPEPTDAPEPVVIPDAGRSKRLRAYLADFQDVDWYAACKGAEADGDTAKMILDLPRNSMFRSTVEDACRAMTGYVNGNTRQSEGLSRIEIRNTENEPLAWTGIDGSCSTFSGG